MDKSMSLIEKIKAIGLRLFNAITEGDKRCASRDAIIAERDETITLLKAQIGGGNAAADDILANTTPTPTPNPTEGADALVAEANASETPNTAAIDEAMDSTVGTTESTSEEAVAEAVEILSGVGDTEGEEE